MNNLILEDGTGAYELEDGSGVLILETSAYGLEAQMRLIEVRIETVIVDVTDAPVILRARSL